jgi:hypothetical protein
MSMCRFRGGGGREKDLYFSSFFLLFPFFPFSQMRKATHFLVLGHIWSVFGKNLVNQLYLKTRAKIRNDDF